MRIAGSLRIGTFGGSRSRVRRARQVMGVESAKSSKTVPFAALLSLRAASHRVFAIQNVRFVDPDNDLQACVQRSEVNPGTLIGRVPEHTDGSPLPFD